MSGCLKKCVPIFEVILLGNSACFTALLSDKKISKLLLCGLTELCFNILYTELPLSEAERAALKKRKKFIKFLATEQSKPQFERLECIRKNRLAAKTIVEIVITGSLKSLK